LLAEAGLAGKLLYEVNRGELRQRFLTRSQKQLVDALLQSRAWQLRKAELRQAHESANTAFESVYRSDPSVLRRELKFYPTLGKLAFLEFVEFLHAQNAHLFREQWRKVETTFGYEAASALQDILNTYDDWYYLYGQELDTR